VKLEPIASSILVALGICVPPGPAIASEKRPVTVEDCVCVRRIIPDEVKVSPDRKQVAFLVKAPNLTTNKNEYQLRLRNLENLHGIDNGKLILSSTEELSGVRWLKDGKRIALLENRAKPKSRILFVDTIAGTAEIITEAATEIMDYSVNSDGDTVAYTTFLETLRLPQAMTSPEIASRGFHIPFKVYPQMLAHERNGYTERQAVQVLRRKQNEAVWAQTTVSSPADKLRGGQSLAGFNQPFGISLSPDGNYLAFLYAPDAIPHEWSKSCVLLDYQLSIGENPSQLALFNTRTHLFIGPIKFPYAFSPIRWSDDSRVLVLPAAAPVESQWEEEDCQARRGLTDFHVFGLDVPTMAVSEVLSRTTPAQGVEVVSWVHGDDEMIVELTTEKSFVRLKRVGRQWNEVGRVIPELDENLSSVTTLDGNVLLGVRQAHTVPPDLVFYDTESKKHGLLTDLNPDVRALTLGSFESEEWSNAYGESISGDLIKPPDFTPGKKYPLVIMLTWPDDKFVCDGYYTTAFPPQPLANAEFVVLIFNVGNLVPQGSRRPEGSPAIQEAKTMVASVEAAVDHLERKGIADRNNVGIIGFSRSSWKVDYMLTHSTFRFRAASSADGGAYNYGGYWLFDGWGAESEEVAYGGPPYGAALQNWIRYAPAFNADKVHSPLLIEFTGNGRSVEPIGAYEFHTALNVLGKAVELFFYPGGEHPLDTPFERVASLQRNLDWFRFWMQHKEDPAPAYDPDQFVRWRELVKVFEKDVSK